MTFYQLRILYLMAFCLCLTVKAAAQQPVIEDGFRMLTFRDGLAGTSVTDIITDHNGEMWIATSNGVNTYNGKRLTTFKLGEESLQNHVDGQKLKTILVADTPMDMANSVRDIHKGSDGRRYHEAGTPFTMRPGKWIGAKMGYVATCLGRQSNRGWIDADWFRVTRK